jgi:hypothetical protein
MPGQPGHPDLILAEFQAKMRTGELGENYPPDPAEEKAGRGASLLIRWAIMLFIAGLILLNANEMLVTVAVIAFLILAGAAETRLWRRCSREDAQAPAE